MKQNQISGLIHSAGVLNDAFLMKQTSESMQKVWGGLVDQVTFVKYNPWENVYDQPANKLEEPCTDLWRRMFVWWDGKVNPCDVDYKSSLSIGSIKNDGLDELWQSDIYNEIRKSHINKKRGSKNPCAACTFI